MLTVALLFSSCTETANADLSALYSIKQVQKVNVFQYDDGISSDVITQVNTELHELPEKFIKQFIHDGWTILVTNQDLNEMAEHEEGNTVIGLIVYDEKEIYIKGESWAAADSVLHEVGHWFSYYIGNYNSDYTDTDNWERIYTEESQTYLSHYGYAAYLSEAEMFAEAFWQYWENPELLKQVCPKTYIKMDALIKAFL